MKWMFFIGFWLLFGMIMSANGIGILSLEWVGWLALGILVEFPLFKVLGVIYG